MIRFDISNDFVAINYQGRSGPFLHENLYKASDHIVDRAIRSPKQSVGAMAITIKNMVGLMCDSVANL